ncbi:hypothetical protein J8F10_18055 [Gemmata sp. G18]|uniref:Uncharacterized protein n=1 Tax=Gemmata palustris TaxID=2822762 RepID=A0ABS5BV47_9BACT|nr:hypothetical protein [Gemmata palustris]MBP3957170.1 hypothetical protein [Gemmata palustris]
MRTHAPVLVLDDLSFLDGGATAPDHVVWDAGAAQRLMDETDGTVAASGVPGTDPIIWSAAERCVGAQRRRDLAAVRAACRAIRDRVNDLSGTRRA